MPLQLDYYYGNEAEQYSFYRIPKVLFTDSRFKGLSVEAKVLYGLLLDRMALSVRNNWLDQDGRVYIIYTIADVMETLGCAEQKANKLLNELDAAKGVGLVERVRRGLGKPNVIYVKNFISGGKPDTRQESQIKNCENHKSGNAETTSQQLRKSQTNKTDLNKTDLSNTDPSIYAEGAALNLLRGDSAPCGPIGEEQMGRMGAYREIIKDNIEFDILAQDAPFDRERLEGLVELMAEVCSTGRKTVRINQTDMPAEVVKGRFLKLDSRHIRYVMDCMDRTTSLIGNIRAYLLSALFNSPVTISQYYSSLVNHDMAEGLLRGG